MITTIVGWLVAKGVSSKLAKPLVWAGIMVLIVAALGTVKCVYDRSVIKNYVAGQEAKQAKRERKADTNLERQRDKDEEAARQRRQEIDDATRNIPDQAPSARQRARACVELRRDARANGRPEPAC